MMNLSSKVSPSSHSRKAGRWLGGRHSCSAKDEHLHRRWVDIMVVGRKRKPRTCSSFMSNPRAWRPAVLQPHPSTRHGLSTRAGGGRSPPIVSRYGRSQLLTIAHIWNRKTTRRRLVSRSPRTRYHDPVVTREADHDDFLS